MLQKRGEFQCRRFVWDCAIALWQQLLPLIATMRPATGLCWYCQKGVTKQERSANLPNDEKTVAVREHEEHLQRATSELTHYRDVRLLVKESILTDLILGPHPSMILHVATNGRATTASTSPIRCTFCRTHYSLDPSTSSSLPSVAFSVLPVRHSRNRLTSCWMRASTMEKLLKHPLNFSKLGETVKPVRHLHED